MESNSSVNVPLRPLTYKDEPEIRLDCGVFNFRPKWMQRLANPKVLLLNFAIVSILQGSYLPYLVGSLTTLEKRYAYDGKLTGLILIADNFSSLLLSPIFGYLGNRLNRSRLLASGMMVVSFSCYLTTLPYFIYGTLQDFHSKNSTSMKMENEMCDSNVSNQIKCENGETTVWPAYVIIWIASFLNGVGYTAFYTLSLPFVDDNVSKRNAPVYISILSTIRLIGPSFGFVCSSLCLRLYEDPWNPPDIGIKDPRWIGAWWLGLLLIGTMLFICSLPLFAFPPHLKKDKKVKAQKEHIDKSKEIKESLSRMIKNPLLICNTLSSCFKWLGLAGYYISQPKYMEAYYKQSASSASFITGLLSHTLMYAKLMLALKGSTTTFSMAIGIMLGGVIIRIFAPRPRYLTSLIFVLEFASNIAIVTAMFLSCPQTSFFGADYSIQEFTMTNACNDKCDCSYKYYEPVCSTDRTTNYFSACHAGCSQETTFVDSNNASITHFANCLCENFGEVKKGPCPVECNSFLPYIIVLCVGKFIASLAKSGNILIELRSVEQRDKNLMMGVAETFLSIFCFIPYPLLFGAITDASCLIWEEKCGKRGNCWVYDNERLRYYLHGTTFILITLGSIFDIGTICFSDRMKNLYVEDDKIDTRDENSNKEVNESLLVARNRKLSTTSLD